MTVIVGIVIVALITWIIPVFGMAPFQVYERYAIQFGVVVRKSTIQSLICVTGGPGFLKQLFCSSLSALLDPISIQR